LARDPFRRNKATITAGEALGQITAEHGLTDEMRAHRAIVEWSTIVGQRIAAVAWPESLTRGVLWVRVKNSPWLHELNLMRGQLLAQLARALDEPGRPPLITELRFHQRPRPTEDGDLIARLRAAGLVRTPRPRRQAVAAVGEAKAAIEAEAAILEDPELRALVREVRIRNGR
jgi:Dna[CI] antecedent, DciA